MCVVCVAAWQEEERLAAYFRGIGVLAATMWIVAFDGDCMKRGEVGLSNSERVLMASAVAGH